jgi:hypothetical protein
LSALWPNVAGFNSGRRDLEELVRALWPKVAGFNSVRRGLEELVRALWPKVAGFNSGWGVPGESLSADAPQRSNVAEFNSARRARRGASCPMNDYACRGPTLNLC